MVLSTLLLLLPPPLLLLMLPLLLSLPLLNCLSKTVSPRGPLIITFPVGTAKLAGFEWAALPLLPAPLPEEEGRGWALASKPAGRPVAASSMSEDRRIVSPGR